MEASVSATTGEAVSQANEDYNTARRFLEARSTIFQEPMRVQEFIQKTRAAAASEEQKKYFYRMMKALGDEIQARQRVIPSLFETKNLKALDICMTPGGYSEAVLKYNRHAQVCGLSLPRDEGGHDVLLPDWKTDKRIEIQFIDITMLAEDFLICFVRIIPMRLNSTMIHPPKGRYSMSYFATDTFSIRMHAPMGLITRLADSLPHNLLSRSRG